MVKVATMLQNIQRNAPSRRFEFPKMRGIEFSFPKRYQFGNIFCIGIGVFHLQMVHKVELLNVDILRLRRGHRELSMSTVKYLDNSIYSRN